MRVQPTIFQELYILQYRGKRIGFRLTLQNVFSFLFLDNGEQKVSPSIRRCFQLKPLEVHSAPWSGMRIQSSLMNATNSLMYEILNDMKPRDQHD